MPTGVTQTLPVSAMRWDETKTIMKRDASEQDDERLLLMPTTIFDVFSLIVLGDTKQ
jgi:hypothetical protein